MSRVSLSSFHNLKAFWQQFAYFFQTSSDTKDKELIVLIFREIKVIFETLASSDGSYCITALATLVEHA